MAEGGRSSPPMEDSRIVVSVDYERREDLTLALKVRGLKAKSSFSKFFSRLGKLEDPGCLMANAEIKTWDLTETGLSIKIVVRTKKKKRREEKEKKKAEAAGGAAVEEDETSDSLEKFHLRIEQFPCPINPESIKYDVREADSGKGFIFISMQKTEAGTSWKQFQADNGTIDAAAP